MKNYERRIIIFRLFSIILLFVPLIGIVISSIYLFFRSADGIVLDCVALFSTGLFCLFQIILIASGKKKESNLKKIAFEEGERINVFPLVMVLIGAAFGITITTIGSVIYMTKFDKEIRINMTIIMCIGVYLIANVLIYLLYLLMFRKREFKIEDLLK